MTGRHNFNRCHLNKKSIGQHSILPDPVRFESDGESGFMKGNFPVSRRRRRKQEQLRRVRTRKKVNLLGAKTEIRCGSFKSRNKSSRDVANIDAKL
jgi:hypothetical protein